MRQFQIAPAYMQSHPFTRDILYCPVDDGTDLLDEPDERGNVLSLKVKWRSSARSGARSTRLSKTVTSSTSAS